ncbi:unnamed protein product, partial [Mesorhabditis spiculigera]
MDLGPDDEAWIGNHFHNLRNRFEWTNGKPVIYKSEEVELKLDTYNYYADRKKTWRKSAVALTSSGIWRYYPQTEKTAAICEYKQEFYSEQTEKIRERFHDLFLQHHLIQESTQNDVLAGIKSIRAQELSMNVTIEQVYELWGFTSNAVQFLNDLNRHFNEYQLRLENFETAFTENVTRGNEMLEGSVFEGDDLKHFSSLLQPRGEFLNPLVIETDSSTPELEDDLKEEKDLKRPDLKGTFRCKLCSKVFCHSSSLSRHRMQIHFKYYKCTLCRREIHSSDSLRTHMYSKHGISRMFICRCCNWAFPDKRALHFHIQVKEESEARIEAASLLGSTSMMANLPSTNSTKQEIPGLAATERIHRELMQQHQLFQQHLVHQHQNVIPQPTPIHGIPSIPPAPTMPSAFSIDPKSAFSPLIRRPATSNNNSPNFATLDQPAMPLPAPSATQTPITTATATSQHSFPQPCSQAEAFQQALLQHMMNTKLQGIPFPTNPLITAGLYQMATAQLPPEQRGQLSFPTSSAVSATESEASLHTPKSSHARTTSDDTEPPRLKMQTLRNPMYPDVAPHISPSDSHTSGSGSPTGPNCQTPRECFECQQARAQIATLQKRYEELEQNKGRVHAELLRLRQDTQNLPAVFGAVDAENRRMKEILREIKQRIDDFQSSPKSGDEGHLFATALRGCIY